MNRIFLLYPFLAAFALVYVLLMRSDLAGWESARTTAEALYSLPLVLCSFVLLGAVAVESLRHRQATSTGSILWTVGVTIMVAGYWTSALTRYDAAMVITEGQQIQPGQSDRVPGYGYAGKFGRPPQVAVELLTLHPVLTSDGTALTSIEGEFVVRTHDKDELCRIDESSSCSVWPARLRIRDMGYSPRYELTTVGSDVTDSSFVFLNIFPPGREDSFRLQAPITYYVRYVPEGGEIANARLHLRIARNKDIVFDRDVLPGEDIAFENARMRIPEVRRWTVLEITIDYGVPLLWLGALVGLPGLAVRFRERRGGRAD